MKRSLIAAVAFMAGCASAAEFRALELKVSQLERRQAENEDRERRSRDELAAAGSAEDKAIRRDVAMLGARQDAVSQRVVVLEGKTDEAQSTAGKVSINAERLQTIENEQIKLKDAAAQLDTRVAAMEKVIVGGGAPAPAKAPIDDEAMYKEALAAHNAGEFARAREGFERLLREAPDSKFASNAVFWLGEGYFKEKRYPEAMERYTAVIEKYPDSNKRCSAILKLGVALEQLGEKQKAKTFYTEVTKKCADAPEAQEAARRLK
jgi:tol-pal system protein YbgF